MPLFLVSIHGENYRLPVFDGQRRGFYTTRFVEAKTAGEADDAAAKLIHEDPSLADLLNDEKDQAHFEAEEIAEIDALPEGCSFPGTSFVFYEEEAGDD